MHQARWMVILAMGLVAALAGRAEAQGRGGLNAGWGGVDLLLHPTIQADLKLDQAQVGKARDLASDMQDRQKELLLKLEGLTGDLRIKTARELSRPIVEEETKALANLLKPEQLARFQQIDLQQRGIAALTDPKVGEKLQLSPEQTEKLQRVLNESILKKREALSSTRGNRRASTDKIEQIRKDTDAKAVDLLTDSQKDAWKQMIGEPLELTTSVRASR